MDPLIDSGSCAFAAIRKHIMKLNRSIVLGQIPESLYAEELIDEDTYEWCLSSSITDSDKGKKIAREVHKRVRLCSGMMDKLFEILKSEKATEDLADEIQETYRIKLEDAKTKSQSKFEIDYQNLKEELEQCKSDLAQPDAPQTEIDVIIKFKISAFVKTSAESSVNAMDIYHKLSSLCYENFTIPSRLCDWVMKEVEKAAVPKPQTVKASDVKETKPTVVCEPLPPLPTPALKELLYYSSLCCQAVSTCTVANYRKFFSGQANPHSFDEISMSISQDIDEVDRYLIAVQGQTIYVAFQSEPSIQDWMSKYSSFSEGLKKEASRIPFVFFWERLREHKRIVLTGFSYGGMLACSVAAILWKDSCIPIEHLEKNVVCITYGQPVIRIPSVQQVIKDIPHFQDTIYCIFKKDDVFPTVLRYFSCIPHVGNQSNRTALSTSTSKPPSTSIESVEIPDLGTDQVFKESGIPQQFLSDLSLLQKLEVSYSTVVVSGEKSTDQENALNRIKQDLTDASTFAKAWNQSLLCGRYCFQILEKEGQDIWSAIPIDHNELTSLIFGFVPKMAIDPLLISSFWKHKMEDYRAKILKAFLLKEPEKFPLPQHQERNSQVSHLKPNVTSVSVHFFPNEHAVVLEGENLSFCYEVQLGEYSNTLKIKSPELLTPRVIQFNFPPDKKTRNVNISEDSIMKVTLRSHFSNPIRKRVKVNKESFSFSLREIQIAKYSPKEVICLAFMSAMLERYSNSLTERGPSKRLKSITHFLEEAVKVVPLESVFSAVAYMDDLTSIECAKALFESRFKFPPSESMCNAANLAEIRMLTGVNGAFIDSYIHHVIRQAAPIVPSKTGRYIVQAKYHSPSKELELSVVSPSQATYAEAVKQHMHELILSPYFSRSHPFPLPGISYFFDISKIPRSEEDYPFLAQFFSNIIQEGTKAVIESAATSLDELSGLSIEHIYPVNSHRRHSTAIPVFQSPLKILHKARESLENFVEENQEELNSSQQFTNERMLELVKDIFDNKVKICATLLGAFMEQQIKIPLLKDSQKSTAELLSSKSAPVAMGVWALFSSTFQELQDLLSSMEGNPLVVEIRDYIAGVLSDDLRKKRSHSGSKYDGKLQFLLQACSQKVVTCSSEYISYSLEHQLCNKFDTTLSVKELTDKWDTIFKSDALAFVATSHRPLIARWLKWANLIYDLRSSLASYTCVGVTGLVNSGKSQLIKKLFGIKTQVGILEKTRTTIPFLYNLDGIVDGLDIIDFPGVDDKENNVPKLADMLIGLAQIVVFVCDQKRIFTDQAKQWLEQLKKEDIPVILCLTFADELYLHFIGEENGNPEPTEFKRREIGREFERKLEKIGHHASRKVAFYCFNIPAGYKTEVNSENLQKMGIGTPLDVGYELVKVFEKTLKQEDIAKQLKDRMDKLSSGTKTC